jgi:Flp pilus assembly protein TadG
MISQENYTRDNIMTNIKTNFDEKSRGQGLVELALILPILLLVIYGVLELGRAFFAYIAISNAAREGARVFTFRPDVTTLGDINVAVTNEVGNVPLIDEVNISSISVDCGSSYNAVNNNTELEACPQFEPIRVTVTFDHDFIFELIFPQTITIVRSVEMFVP